jgi:hypothetical protein
MNWFEYLTTCNKKTFFSSISYCNYILVLLIIIVYYLCRNLIVFFYKEGFGATSPGTMVQLRTSHVPTEEDLHYWRNVYPRQVKREIYNMTESDL